MYRKEVRQGESNKVGKIIKTHTHTQKNKSAKEKQQRQAHTPGEARAHTDIWYISQTEAAGSRHTQTNKGSPSSQSNRAHTHRK